MVHLDPKRELCPHRVAACSVALMVPAGKKGISQALALPHLPVWSMPRCPWLLDLAPSAEHMHQALSLPIAPHTLMHQKGMKSMLLVPVPAVRTGSKSLQAEVDQAAEGAHGVALGEAVGEEHVALVADLGHLGGQARQQHAGAKVQQQDACTAAEPGFRVLGFGLTHAGACSQAREGRIPVVNTPNSFYSTLLTLPILRRSSFWFVPWDPQFLLSPRSP